MIVLDSHIWFWWVNGENQRLPSFILAEIEAAPHVSVSRVSCFEAALAHRRGRLELSLPIRDWFSLALAGSDVELLPLTPLIDARAVELPDIHRDPSPFGHFYRSKMN